LRRQNILLFFSCGKPKTSERTSTLVDLLADDLRLLVQEVRVVEN
jgi:hypothetical protein